jgi:glycosyltransferase involved in cell wall biosynthesis
MKIILIGPTYPYRGGIAHHTTLLCLTLRKKHDVKFISFKRQYPQFLFPGKSDRDTSRNPLKSDSVDYLIDSLNPLTWFKAYNVIKKYDPEMIIMPWWVVFWMPQYMTLVTLIKKSLPACKIVFICHNTFEHESHFLKNLASKLVLSKADTLVTQSQEETGKLRQLIRYNTKIVTAFHPTYADLKDRIFDKEESLRRLNLKGHVLLFFGFVRDYKGLEVLLDAMPYIRKKRDVTLLIVGEFWNDKQKYLDKINDYKLNNNVRIVDKYIPNEEVGIYFTASDLVVLPYISVSGSGISQLAYGFDRPVIGSRVGALSEVVKDGENGRLVTSGNSETLAEVIVESLEPETLKRLSQNAQKTKEAFSWQKFADSILE